jgi:hypothetical protein
MKISITNESAIKKLVGNGQTWLQKKHFLQQYKKKSSRSQNPILKKHMQDICIDTNA